MFITVRSRMLCSPLLTLQMHTSKAPSTVSCNHGSHAQRSSQIPFGSLREMQPDCTYFHDQPAFGRELSETLGGAFVQGHNQNFRPASHRRRPLRLGRTTSLRMCSLRRLECAMDKRRLPINERTGAHLQVRARHDLFRYAGTTRCLD